jgi:hypothetical protein
VARLRNKIQNGLDEARTLILGTQVLLGFSFRAAFEPAFAKAPRSLQELSLAGLVLLLVAMALEIASGAYHRIVERGQDTEELHLFLRATVSAALLPLAFGTGASVVLAAHRLVGVRGSLWAGAAVTFTALAAWYGCELFALEEPVMSRPEEADLSHRIRQVLTEARVVLPGAQALLGFQLLTMLTEGFTRLPETSKIVHLASLLCITLATILLITPAAYHRIALGGEETEAFHTLAGRLLLSALVPLGLGVTGDLYLVTLQVTHSQPWSIGLSAVSLALLFGLWFAYPLARRLQRAPRLETVS